MELEETEKIGEKKTLCNRHDSHTSYFVISAQFISHMGETTFLYVPFEFRNISASLLPFVSLHLT